MNVLDIGFLDVKVSLLSVEVMNCGSGSFVVSGDNMWFMLVGFFIVKFMGCFVFFKIDKFFFFYNIR